MTTTFGRVNILGVCVHDVNMDSAVSYFFDLIEKNRRGYVCVTGVHGVVESQKNESLRNIHNQSLLTVPDGMPTVWVGRWRGHKQMGRVYGPDMMRKVCKQSVKTGATHFLYGGVPGVAEEMKNKLEERFPGIKVVGTYSPPFRPLNAEEESELKELVAQLKPDFFWVGLSTPKQEAFMAEHVNKLDARIMLGVGAAFDIHSGRQSDAPRWIKRSGLQWFFRLCQNPKRLWKRYFTIVPKFLWLILLQELGVRKWKMF